MLDIKIIAVGKLKYKPWQEAADEYIKRLKPYARIKTVELKAESFSDADDINKIKNIEAEKILNELSKTPNAQIYLLTEVGKQLASVDLAKNFSKITGQIVFVIGGTLGLSRELLDSKYIKLSLSPLTFTHELARVILLEQIYRVVAILQGKAYHY